MTEGKSLLQRWQVRLTAFEELTGKWRDVGLSALQRSPDAAQLAALRESAVQSRRQLGARTKEFAKLGSEEKLAEMGALIRHYQEHIDAVTKCEVFAEKAFSELHRCIANIVDPYPMMDKFIREKATILGFVKAQDECDAVRRSLAEYESELQELKNQEVTIERLQGELARAEMAASSRVEQSAQEATVEQQHLLRQWQERERASQKELKDAASKLAKAEADNRALQAQASACRQRLDELAVQREQEVEDLVTELDDSHTRIATLERSLHAAAAALANQSAAAQQRDVSLVSPEATPVAKRAQPEATPNEEETAKRLRDAVNDAVAVALTAEREKHRTELTAAQLETDRQTSAAADADRRWQTATDEAAGLQHTVRSLNQEISSRAERVTALEAECQGLRAAVRRLEGELRCAPGTARPTDASLDVPPPFGAAAAAGGVAAAATVPNARDLLSASGADFLAVANQRDVLRQRLLSLEEASSTQIHSLTVEVHHLQDECGKLRGLVRLHQASGIYVRPGESGSGEDEVDHRSLAELSKVHGRSVATREATIRFLDGVMQVLQRHVLTNLQLRRTFLGYLVALHGLMVLSVLKRVLLG